MSNTIKNTDNTHKIQVLAGVSAVQKRPGMYVGDIEGDTTHLAIEVLDNAVDEVIRGKAKSIHVEINNKTNVFSIADSGGGLPIHIIEGNEHEGIPDRDSVDVTFTVLHSSGKFDNSTYKQSGGLHGVGLVCVNALSEYTTVYIKKHQRIYYKYMFVNGRLTKGDNFPNGQRVVKLDEKDAIFSTKIIWKPSAKYYKNSQSVNERTILSKLELVNVKLNPEITYNGKRLKKKSFESLLRSTLIKKEADAECEFFILKNQVNNDKVEIHFTFTENDINFLQSSDVNLIPCTGKFLTLVTNLFVNALNDILDVRVTTKDITKFLKIWVSVQMDEPVFSGQTKERMDKSLARLINPKKSTLVSMFLQLPFLKLQMLRIKKSKTKTLSKTSSKLSADNPLIDCISSSDNTLFICEGKSAMSAIRPIRNRKTEAVFPVTGKIMNSANYTFKQLCNSAKIKFLCEAIGINIENIDASKYRYSKYKIIADADSDGYHIVMLVVSWFAKFAPDIIKNGNLSVVQTPLWGYMEKGKLVPLFLNSDIEAAKGTNKKIIRFKGLGEFNPTQLKPLIGSDILEYIVTWPKTQLEHELILKLINDTDVKKIVKADMQFNTQLFIKKAASKTIEDI